VTRHVVNTGASYSIQKCHENDGCKMDHSDTYQRLNP